MIERYPANKTVANKRGTEFFRELFNICLSFIKTVLGLFRAGGQPGEGVDRQGHDDQEHEIDCKGLVRKSQFFGVKGFPVGTFIEDKGEPHLEEAVGGEAGLHKGGGQGSLDD